ncbi:hypothetical protein B0T20DRAFT_465335 [Sordaria brevicollis]|uniref:Uncharacterized protein n=1 Tax=Sordaria brevicollis TaxID=83679 RepID=A0AAE0U0Q4_SORBR|nr:hypothetical protein B0T20DRAFT_465335 [Sordaria brevicollis]
MRFPSSYSGKTKPRQLSRRGDICAEVYPNGGAESKTCAPGRTTCCHRKGQSFPRCVDGGGPSWCCEGTGSRTSFTNQPSACSEPDSVSCTNLARGTKKACCPSKAKCDDRFEASESNVRCQVAFDDLMAVAGVKRRWVVLPSSARSNTVSETGVLTAAGGHSTASSPRNEAGTTSSMSSSTTTPSPTSITPATASSTPPPKTNPPPTAVSPSPFWTSKASIASLTLCIILSVAFLGLLAFSLHRQQQRRQQRHRRRRKKNAQQQQQQQQQKHKTTMTRLSLPRGAYLPERPVYLAVESEDCATNAEAPSHGYHAVAVGGGRHLEPGPGPGYYGVLPIGLAPGPDWEREEEEEEEEEEGEDEEEEEERLAELDNTQMKEVLNGEGP